MTAGGRGTRAGDLARRIAHRREELGLAIDEVAQRAGMDGGYLDYLENTSAPSLTIEGLTRLAFALETTVADLAGGNVDRPPGTGRAGPHPSLEVLSKEQCVAHLTPGGVGRLVFLAERGPVALPVNFRFFKGDVVFRTQGTGALATVAGGTVSFEVDHIDEATSEGWSVVVTGDAARVDDPSEVAHLARLGIEPWAGGSRETFVRVKSAEISGRRTVFKPKFFGFASRRSRFVPGTLHRSTRPFLLICGAAVVELTRLVGPANRGLRCVGAGNAGGAGRFLQSRTVPFDRCPEATSLSGTEPPSGDGSTLSSSSDGELASEATF